MKKVHSAPSLTDLSATSGAVARPVAARIGLLNAECRFIGDGGWKSQSGGPRAASVSPLPGISRASQTTTRPCVRTSAVALPDVAPVMSEISKDLGGVAKSVEEEVVVESGLHVVGVAAGGCYERFGMPMKLAPSLVQEGQIASHSDDELELAVCMATPFEGGDDVGLGEQVQKSLDDLALKSEIHFEIECALDSLAEMTLSDSDERTLGYLRTARGRQYRRRTRAGRQGRKKTQHPKEHDGKENIVHGNVVSVGGLKGVLKKTLPQG